MQKSDQASGMKRSGMNCCQAVLCAFAEELNTDPAALKALGAGFGAGMGTAGATCGALCGAQMVCGMLGKPASRQIYREFEQKCGATVCGDLKGAGTGKMLCSCDDCVRNAAEIAEKVVSPMG